MWSLEKRNESTADKSDEALECLALLILVYNRNTITAYTVLNNLMYERRYI